MNRAPFVAGALVCSLFLLSFSGLHSGGSTPAKRATIKTLIIDPGHGGFDDGARGSYSNEDDKLGSIPETGKGDRKEFPDIKIIYTRTTDIMPGNKRTRKRACATGPTWPMLPTGTCLLPSTATPLRIFATGS